MRFQSIPKIAQFICTMLVVCMAFYGVARATMAPAGIKIENIATGQFLDQNGDTYNLTSNPVTIEVIPVWAAQLTQANEMIAGAGQLVTWPHVLTNTSNIADTFQFSVSDVGGDSGQLVNIQLIHDVNNNGIYDTGDALIDINTHRELLAVGQKMPLLIQARIPLNVADTDFFFVKIEAKGIAAQSPQLSQQDKVYVKGAQFNLNKSVNKTEIHVNANDANAKNLTYGLDITNAGNASAQGSLISINGENKTKITFEDPLPAGVVLTDIFYNGSGGGELLYHVSGTGEKTYQRYDKSKLADFNSIDRIAIAYDTFAPATTEHLEVNVALVSPNVFTLNNQFVGYYQHGSEQKKAFSNTVSTKVLSSQFTLTPANTVLKKPDDIATWPHILTNTGNIADVYHLNVTDLSGDNGVLVNPILIHDVDGNGKYDPIIDKVIDSAYTISLKPSEKTALLVLGTVPSAALAHDFFELQLAASNEQPIPHTVTRIDRVETIRPAFELTKSVDKTEINLQSTDAKKFQLNYRLKAVNTGNFGVFPRPVSINGISVNKILLEDIAPTGVQFQGVTNTSGKGQLLYRLVGSNTYLPYNSNQLPDFTKVSALALALDEFAPNQSETLDIQAIVTDITIGASFDNHFSLAYLYSGTNVTVDSNTVNTKIFAYKATLTAAPDLTLDPLTTAVWKHTLTNTGNLEDSYRLTLTDVTTDKGLLGNVLLIHDINKNGIYDAADKIIQSDYTITLKPNEQALLLVKGDVPKDVLPNDFFDLNLTAISQQLVNPQQLTQIDTVKTVTPAVELVKKVDKLDIDFKAAATTVDILTYTLTATNKGITPLNPIDISIDGVASKKIIFKDILPANVTLLNDKDPANLVKATENTSGKGMILYHLIGETEHNYHRYNEATAPHPSKIDAIAVAYDTFAVAETDSIKLRVNIFNNATGATINNIFQAYYFYGIETRQSVSNVQTTTIKGSASLSANDQYYNLVGRVALNGNVYLEAKCAQCNLRPDFPDRLKLEIKSTKSGDVETVVAIETGNNTGIFRISDAHLQRVDALPSRSMFEFPAERGNYIIETTAHDTLIATILYCLDDTNTERPNSRVLDANGNPVSSTLLVDPFGIVFDSSTNKPIAGATVRLVLDDGKDTPAIIFDDSHRRCTPPRDPLADIACQDNVTTGADGAYRFPLVAPATYKLIITAPSGYQYPSVVSKAMLNSQFPARIIHVTGSYGGSFQVTPTEGPVELDVPMDPPAVLSSILFVKKTATRKTVELGDFIDYTVNIRNASTTNTKASNVFLVDKLPQGFSYVLGSAKVDKVAQEPTGGHGPTLTFAVGDVTSAKEIVITYRVQVGVGALRSDGINRAQATERIAGGTFSNEAVAQVTVLPGVFSTEAFVTGKVYTDCNRSGVQDQEEIGVPGVRLLLEDGSYVVTDVEGKYDFYGLRPKTHILKLDRTTLPADVELIEQSVRNAGDPASRFVDLKAGELHRADFAITTDNATCSGSAMTEIYSRRNQGDKAIGELERALKADLNFETINPSDVRSLPASGCVISSGNECGVHGKAQMPRLSSAITKSTTDDIIRVTTATDSRTLESYLEDDSSNKLEILNLKDQQVLTYAQTRILFKGTLGARFELTLNGDLLEDKSVGTKLTLGTHQLEAREYIGINLKAGKNRISLKQFDGLGNVRGTSVVNVIAPDGLSELKMNTNQKNIEANGSNEVLLNIKLLDKQGVAVTSRTGITLESNMGRFRAIDLDEKSAGTQIFVEGGEFTVKLVAPTEAGEALVRASSGIYKAETKVRFVPELRPMVAAGIIEGMVSFKNFDSNKVSAANAKDGFEDELKSLANANDGKLNLGGRAAMFLKGKVKGEYLLTLSYDSDKDTNQRLFRDIRPDDYYPVYGDSAVKGFDAQSTSKLYVRLDKGRSYAMFGDYTTRLESDTLALGQYSRSLTGVRAHYETDNLKASTFVAQTKSKQVVFEVPALGISGPYALAGLDGLLVNSEKVEIIKRDRNNTGFILSSTQMSRFSDYEFEPLSSSFYFKAPVPSLDANLNPISIRVTVEVEDKAGVDYWVGGVQAEQKLGEKVTVGAAAVQEDVPDDAYRLASVNTKIVLGAHTTLIAEAAQSDRETKDVGQATRAELNYIDGPASVRVYYGESDAAFENPSSPLSSGRAESGVKLQLNLNSWGTLLSEAVRTEDTTTGGVRQGVKASINRTVNKYLSVELGARYYDETAISATPLTSLGVTPYEGVTARGKLNVQVPQWDGASAYAEYEQDTANTDRRMMAVGADYRLGTKGKLYARHEFASSLSGNFGLNDQQQRNTTVVGIEDDYMQDGRVFSEYRVRDAITATDTEAAIGLRNRWSLTKGIRLNTNLERVTTLEGSDASDATAVSLGLEYLTNPLWKATGKIDLRWADTADSILNTLGFAYKMSRDWTLLAKNMINLTDNHTSGNRLQERFQLGTAYRQVDTNRWDALTKIEYKLEKDESNITNLINRDAYIFSNHLNYHPVRRWTFANQLAAKWVTDSRDDLTSKSSTYLIGLRAIHDLTERWEASVQAGWLSGDAGGKRYVLGAESGYLVTTNLWLSMGYNWLSYQDADVVGSDFTVDGLYLRMRFKFDEDLFKADKPSINKTLEPNNVSL